MGDKDYQQGYKDGQASAEGKTDFLTEIGKGIARPFTAVINPDYTSGESQGYKDGLNKK